jgi:hypothetical protein
MTTIEDTTMTASEETTITASVDTSMAAPAMTSPADASMTTSAMASPTTAAMTTTTSTFTSITPTPQVTEAAPVLLSAQFDPSGNSIKLLFNKSISIVNPSTKIFIQSLVTFPCSFVVLTNDTTNGILGLTSDDCKARLSFDQMSVQILPPSSLSSVATALNVNGTLTLVANAVFSRDTFFSLTAVGTAIASAPASVINPSFSFSGPTTVGECYDMNINVNVEAGCVWKDWQSVTITSS